MQPTTRTPPDLGPEKPPETSRELLLDAQEEPLHARREIASAAVDAVTGGIRSYGPDAVGILLVGVAAVLVGGLSILVLGLPWPAGLGAGGVTAGVGAGAAIARASRPPPDD